MCGAVSEWGDGDGAREAMRSERSVRKPRSLALWSAMPAPPQRHTSAATDRGDRSRRPTAATDRGDRPRLAPLLRRTPNANAEALLLDQQPRPTTPTSLNDAQVRQDGDVLCFDASLTLRWEARDMCCFYMPVQWVMACLQWAAGETMCHFPRGRSLAALLEFTLIASEARSNKHAPRSPPSSLLSLARARLPPSPRDRIIDRGASAPCDTTARHAFGLDRACFCGVTSGRSTARPTVLTTAPSSSSSRFARARSRQARFAAIESNMTPHDTP